MTTSLPILACSWKTFGAKVALIHHLSHPCPPLRSGLDSSTALHLLSVLRGLASGGRSVVTTIHQPSSRLYQQLDKLLLLSQARRTGRFVLWVGLGALGLLAGREALALQGHPGGSKQHSAQACVHGTLPALRP